MVKDLLSEHLTTSDHLGATLSFRKTSPRQALHFLTGVYVLDVGELRESVELRDLAVELKAASQFA